MDLSMFQPVILSLKKGDILVLKTKVDVDPAQIEVLGEIIKETVGFFVPVVYGDMEATIVRPEQD